MSTDGLNFSSLPATVPTYSNFDDNIDWCVINRLACSPTSERVWAATNKGLKYSDDLGTTWTNAKQNTGSNTINLTGYGTDVKIATTGKSVLFTIHNIWWKQEQEKYIFLQMVILTI